MNPESIRILMSWNATPQVAALVGLQHGQLLNFAANKFTPTDDQLSIMAEYLVHTTGMSIEEQLVKRGRQPFPGNCVTIPKNDPRIFGEKATNGAGRPKGQKNIIGRVMKELIFQAGESTGSDGKGTGGMAGYLSFLSKAHPPLYVMLLQRLVPQETHVEADIAVGVKQINIVPVKAATYFSPEEVARMLQHDLVIEGEAS